MSRLFHDGIIDDNTLVQLPDGSTRPYAHVKDGTGTGKPVLPHKPVVPSKPASPKSAAPTPLKRVAMPAIPVEGPSSTYLGECPRCGKKTGRDTGARKMPALQRPLAPGLGKPVEKLRIRPQTLPVFQGPCQAQGILGLRIMQSIGAVPDMCCPGGHRDARRCAVVYRIGN